MAITPRKPPPSINKWIHAVADPIANYAAPLVPSNLLDQLPAITWFTFDTDEKASHQQLLGAQYTMIVNCHAETEDAARILANTFYVSVYQAVDNGLVIDGTRVSFVEARSLPQESRTAGQQFNDFKYSATYRLIAR